MLSTLAQDWNPCPLSWGDVRGPGREGLAIYQKLFPHVNRPWLYLLREWVSVALRPEKKPQGEFPEGQQAFGRQARRCRVVRRTSERRLLERIPFRVSKQISGFNVGIL